MKLYLAVVPLLLVVVSCGSSGKPGVRRQGAGAKAFRDIGQSVRCETMDGRVIIRDLNKDGQVDTRQVYRMRGDGEVIACRELDMNFDGRLDLFFYFDEEGEIKRDEVDLDFDGVTDIVSHYYKRQVVRQEMDTNSDGVSDRVRYLENGMPVRLEGDTNHDGEIDYWEYYEMGRLVRIGVDTDGDGRADTWDRDEEAMKEAEEAASEGGESSEAIPEQPAADEDSEETESAAKDAVSNTEDGPGDNPY